MRSSFRRDALLGGVGVVLTCCGLAAGQISQSSGVDVIVGELPSVYHWTDSGAVNGMRAYSVGTTSCNQGDQPLSWQASPDPDHPVIGQTMYRYADDASGLMDAGGQPVKRFQQIGQSWLKHGFTALQGTVCSGEFDFPCNATGGTTLGTGCSDPYGAQLNGGQSGLGPKSEINPTLGTNLGNHATPTGGALGGRIQVPQSDLSVPGARYFVEGHYIAADDAAAGNDDNNASHREVTVNQSNFNVGVTGPTHRRQAAILAWQALDPGVSVQQVDVANDGRFTVAHKVTDLGGGLYDYDYLIFNMNSDRAGAALRFPLAAGVTVTGSEFAGVDYHSGEPYSNTPWTITNTGSELVFASPQTHAQNPNTNALRWGTTYAFRFQANAAPVTGLLTLDLFKPGTPNSQSIVGLVPGGSVAFNDTCADALPLGGYGSFPFDTTTATNDLAPDPVCNFFSFDDIFQDVWYRFTATCDGAYAVATCGSDFDTKIAVYAGACGGAIVACNDDNEAACGSGSLHSSLTFSGVGGTEYFLRVGGFNNASGTGMLTLSGPPCLPVPGNDRCADATTIMERASVSGTTAGAGADLGASCGGGPDVFYGFSPATSGDYAVAVTPGTIGGATVSIHQGCGGAEVACSSTGSVVAPLTGGQAYIVRVATSTGQSDGSFSLLVQGDVTNDDCANAIPVFDGVPVNGTNVDATGTNLSSCAGSGDRNDVWYRYTPANSATITVSLCGGVTNFDTSLSVFSSCGGSQIACNDDSCGLQSQVSFSGSGGSTYLIRVAGWGGADGDFTLTVTGGGGVQAPANDDCANAVALSDGVAAGGNSSGATGTNLSSCAGSGDTRDVWYSYFVAADDTINVSTCGSAFDTSLSVFSSCGGSQIACNDDDCGLQSSVSFAGSAGQTYLIRVAGFNGATGAFTIVASGGSLPPPPINDNCSNLFAIPANGTLSPIDTSGATLDGPANDGCGAVGADVWFGLGSHAANGSATFDTCGSDYDTVITVYDDSGTSCGSFASRMIGCNDDSCGLQSQITVPVQEGHTYVIRVSGRNGETGSLVLSSSFTPSPTCPCELTGDDPASVDVFDLLAYLSQWFPQDPAADIDGTPGVDVFDLLAYLSCWFPASSGSC